MFSLVLGYVGLVLSLILCILAIRNLFFRSKNLSTSNLDDDSDSTLESIFLSSVSDDSSSTDSSDDSFGDGDFGGGGSDSDW